MSEENKTVSGKQMEDEGTAGGKKRLTRRALLAAMGTAGATALLYSTSMGAANGSAVSEAVYIAAKKPKTPKNSDCCFRSGTIAELRASTMVPTPDELYYVTDPLQEGFFRFDQADTTSTDNTGLVLVSAAGSRWKRIQDDGKVNVTWFGAMGDGVTDDMQTIQQTIDAVFAAGGGIVYFPKGTYIVSPQLSNRIQLRSNVDLLGEDSSSVIKVKDNAGDYWTIFGHLNSSVRVENVRISHLRIDQNVKNNLTCNIDKKRTDTPYFRQYCIALFNYENIVVDNVRFDPTCAVNSITINRPQCKNVTVTNCYFNFVHALGDPEYDNSAIYLNGKNHYIANNVFFAAPGEKARGAMETHTGQSVIVNNVSDGYFTGVHLQASPQGGTRSDMTIAGNTFSNANQGIQFWPLLDSPITQVTITGNTISLTNTFHQRTSIVGISSAGGSADVGYFENITIDGNTIVFDEEFSARPGLVEANVYGIGITKETDLKNITISNNIIKNAPVAGIHFGNSKKIGVISNLSITGNTIINAGHYPASNERYRAGILLRSTVVGAVVSDNIISDTYPEAKGMYAIRMNDQDGTFEDVQVGDNVIRSNQGGLWMDLSPSVKVDQAERYLVFSASYPPAAGSFEPGQIVMITNPSVQNGETPIGYKVVSGGTAGTLTGVQASAGTSSNRVVVNDASSLKVGQYIQFATGNQLRRIVRIAGSEVRLDAALTPPLTAPSAVTFKTPEFREFGSVGSLPAIADTSGLTVSQLESELNTLKQTLRNYGVISI